MSYESRSVATVCDEEVRIYGGVEDGGRRPLLSIEHFRHHGAAVNYAQEYDDAEKARDERRARH